MGAYIKWQSYTRTLRLHDIDNYAVSRNYVRTTFQMKLLYIDFLPIFKIRFPHIVSLVSLKNIYMFPVPKKSVPIFPKTPIAASTFIFVP